MTNRRIFLLVLASLALVNVISFLVLSHNLDANVYPLNADSTSIPIGRGILFSLIVLVLLGTAIFMPKQRIFGMIMSSGLCLLAGSFAVHMAISWWHPDHYAMACAYAALSVPCGVVAISTLRAYARKVDIERV